MQEYWLPNTTNALGYTVIGTVDGNGGITISDYLDVAYYGDNVIANSRRANTNSTYFYDKTICINFKTNYFLKFLSKISPLVP